MIHSPHGIINTRNGIVQALTEWHYFIFDECIFRHNYFPGTYQSGHGWAIQMTGGKLEIRNSCFYNNTFAGWGYVEAFHNTTVIQSGNFAEPPRPRRPIRSIGKEETIVLASSSVSPLEDPDTSVTCNLIAQSSLFAPDLRSDVICLNATESRCLVDGYMTTPQDDTIAGQNNDEPISSSASTNMVAPPVAYDFATASMITLFLIVVVDCLF